MSGSPGAAEKVTTQPRAAMGRSWLEILPWLGAHRAGPSLLGDDVLIPNAWMSTPAGAGVPPEFLGEVCRRIAVVFLEQHRDVRLAVAFPFAFAAADFDDLRLSAKVRIALAGNGAIAALGNLTMRELARLPGIGPAALTEIGTALVRCSIPAPAPAPAVAEVESFVAGLTDRDRFLLTARVLAAKPMTLVSCGIELGISRERVNQLDSRLRNQVRTMFHASRELRRTADILAAAARPMAALGRICDSAPELGAPVPGLGLRLWQVLIRLDDRIDVVDDWIADTSIEAARQRVQKILTVAATPEGLVEIATAAEAFGLPGEETGRALAYLGYRVLNAHVLIRSASVHDAVAAVLALSGEPMTVAEIQAAVVPRRSVSSIRNAMVADERFGKADRTRWGLTRWGTRYVPIHRQIGEILDANGGQIELEELVRQVTRSFDVRAVSVRTYAATGEYVTSAGVVTRRERSYTPRKSPTKTRGLYREGDVIRWRTTIAAAHLKGSAFNLPSALAGMVGVGPNHPVELASRLGPQAVLWVSVQARCGTIKRFVDDLGLSAGDDVFLEFTPGATGLRFDVVPVAAATGGDKVRRALAATGHSAAARLPKGQLRSALAAALWLPPATDLPAVGAALRARGETELADLVAG
ncbi:sigma factor-like helix-turn-helix DNA-binding protein [Nocardia sp. XZ_19_385]|uniref:sigma factor-like helix-turn-helix DNA-binding protein n=1 Tax=Nocardia sp. XZ_19_385 TaxID=2769488 RepID=UPI00188DCA24|nr:sigma factor-like helix-turn-helix DNA-binding protein [Nocardia sp. XZ_19_385]